VGLVLILDYCVTDPKKIQTNPLSGVGLPPRANLARGCSGAAAPTTEPIPLRPTERGNAEP